MAQQATTPPELTFQQALDLTDDAKAKLAIDELAWFTFLSWPIIDSKVMDWNWHHDVICQVLAAISARTLQQREVVFCVPPRMTKTRTVSVAWPAWHWLRDPQHSWLATSGVEAVMKKSSLEHRRIVTSPWYQSLVERTGIKGTDGNLWGLTKDQAEKLHFENTATGARESLTTGAKVTGRGGDTIIVDDPYDVQEVVHGAPVKVAERMSDVVDYYDVTLSSRLNDQKTGYRVTIMQRLHDGDLAGVLRKRPGVLYVDFPMEFDPDTAHPWDQRTERGELLFPTRMGADEVARMKRSLGSRHYSAQAQQDPKPSEGGTFKTEWMQQRYPLPPREMAERLPIQAISVDCAFKGGSGSDRVAVQVWGRDGPRKYLLHRSTDHRSYTETRQLIRDVAAAWPRAKLRLVEDKANGPAVIDDLRKTLGGLVPFNPNKYGSKEARGEVSSVAFEAGDVWLPMPEHAPWVLDYIEELCAFPNGRYDDDVDATSQIILHWGAGSVLLAVYDGQSIDSSLGIETEAGGDVDGQQDEDPFAGLEHVGGSGDPISSIVF